jgi:hypothetical protein
MSKYPVEISDDQGVIDAINYLLSGPQGLGQFFKGFSAFAPGYLTGNFRLPFSRQTFYKYANGLNGAYTILLYNSSGIVPGMLVYGPSIGSGAVVTAMNGNLVTLSVANTSEVVDEQVYFDIPILPTLYVPAINLSNAEQLDDRTIKYTFATPQTQPPFAVGNGLSVRSITPSDWNSSSLSLAGSGTGQIGVVECTTTYVIVRTVSAITTTLPAYVSGGTIAYSSTDFLLSTDCNARVVVTGGTDRVFIAAQLNNLISYIATTSSDITYKVQINRYYGIPNNDPTNPDYVFIFDDTVSQKVLTYTGLTGTGTLDNIETIFTTVIDNPAPKFYWYILEVEVGVDTGDLEITQCELGLRSLSAQVVKE